MTKSDLDLIKGIGPKTKEILLRKIGSLKKSRIYPLNSFQ